MIIMKIISRIDNFLKLFLLNAGIFVIINN